MHKNIYGLQYLTPPLYFREAQDVIGDKGYFNLTDRVI